MSTLKINTLSNLAGSQSTPVENAINGSAKAWVNFNGTGTVAIRGSYNISSITDVQTGVYRLNFITAMPDANYATTAIGSEGGGAGDKFYGYQVSTTQAQFVVYNSGGSLVDNGTCQMAIFR
jgi:hypothetical protein